MGYLNESNSGFLFLIIFIISFSRFLLIYTKRMNSSEGKSANIVCGLLALFGAVGAPNVMECILFASIAVCDIAPFLLTFIMFLSAYKSVKKSSYDIANIRKYTDNDWKHILSLTKIISVKVDSENNLVVCSTLSDPLSVGTAYMFSEFILFTMVNINNEDTDFYPETFRNSELFKNLSGIFSGNQVDFSKWQVCWDKNSICNQ